MRWRTSNVKCSGAPQSHPKASNYRAEGCLRRAFLRGGDNEMQPSPERVVDRTAIAGGEDREAGILLDFLQKIIDLDVGITVVAILHLSPLAKEGIPLRRKKRTAPLFFAAKTRRRFFSVSPIYLEKTAPKSTQYRFFPRSRVRIWAATRAPIRSLPVNRARTPFRHAGLLMVLRFVSAPHCPQMNATISPRDPRKRAGNRSSGTIQSSG